LRGGRIPPGTDNPTTRDSIDPDLEGKRVGRHESEPDDPTRADEEAMEVRVRVRTELVVGQRHQQEGKEAGALGPTRIFGSV